MKETCGFFIYSLDREALFVCHSTGSGDMFSIPKGMREENESIKQTAIRELEEETNVKYGEDFEVISEFDLPDSEYRSRKKVLKSILLIVKNFKSDHLYCKTYFQDKQGVDRPEVDFYQWLTLHEASLKLPISQVQLLSIIKEKIRITRSMIDILGI